MGFIKLPTNVLSVVKIELDTLIIHHFIIENTLYDMATRRSLRSVQCVPQRHCYSMLLSIL